MLLYDPFGFFIVDGDRTLALFWGPHYLHISQREEVKDWKEADEQTVHRLVKILFNEKLKDHRNEPS